MLGFRIDGGEISTGSASFNGATCAAISSKPIMGVLAAMPHVHGMVDRVHPVFGVFVGGVDFAARGRRVAEVLHSNRLLARRPCRPILSDFPRLPEAAHVFEALAPNLGPGKRGNQEKQAEHR